ncbi:hypothetical protein [Geoglobus acetivorans]|uniref:hypothetical protein n=1 Tax=Geoglobus acetivorans TaxID=565033 RepID=UPI00064E2D98
MNSQFDGLAGRYDRWYDTHSDLFEKELGTVFKPDPLSPEIGVGTGRFAVMEKKMSRLVCTDNDFVCYLCRPL